MVGCYPYPTFFFPDTHESETPTPTTPGVTLKPIGLSLNVTGREKCPLSTSEKGVGVRSFVTVGVIPRGRGRNGRPGTASRPPEVPPDRVVPRVTPVSVEKGPPVDSATLVSVRRTPGTRPSGPSSSSSSKDLETGNGGRRVSSGPGNQTVSRGDRSVWGVRRRGVGERGPGSRWGRWGEGRLEGVVYEVRCCEFMLPRESSLKESRERDRRPR